MFARIYLFFILNIKSYKPYDYINEEYYSILNSCERNCRLTCKHFFFKRASATYKLQLGLLHNFSHLVINNLALKEARIIKVKTIKKKV